MPSVQHSAATKVAQAYRTNNPERIAQARRELATANIEAAIQRNLEKAPPLTAEQVRTLSGLLRTGGQP
ncbi:putative phiRv1 phage protein [Microbacterium sp. HM58-2]|nr:putative phiRv1 phage protein [Microbacterium sp. HM58-2]